MSLSADQLSNAQTVSLHDAALQTPPPSPPDASSPPPTKKRKRRLPRFSLSDYPGPVFFKELSLLSRRSSTYWTRGLFCLGLTFIIGMTFLGIYMEWSYESSTAYRLQSLQVVSPAIMMALSIFMAVLLPLSAAALSGGAICDERRKGSLSTLMTTPITTLQIIIGKVAGASAQLLMLAFLALPLLLSIRIFGGLPPLVVFQAFTIIVTSTLMVASITTWCSIYAKRPTVAMIRGLVICAAIYFLPLLLYFLSVGLLFRTTPNPMFMVYSSPIALGITLGGMFDSTMTGSLFVDNYSWLVASLVNIGISVYSIALASLSLRKVFRKEQDGGLPPTLQPATSPPIAPTPAPLSSSSTDPSTTSMASPTTASSITASSITSSRASQNSHSGVGLWLTACVILFLAYLAQIFRYQPNLSPLVLPAVLALCVGTYFVIRRLSRTKTPGDVYANPVLWREWRQPSFKSQRAAFAAFGSCTALVFVFALFGKIEPFATVGITTFLTLAMMIVAAVNTTGAFSAERESRTIESLLTTPLSAQEIVIGKLVGALRRQWFAPVLLLFLLLTVGVCTATISPIAVPMVALLVVPPLLFLNATGVLVSILLPKSSQAAVINIFVGLFLWIGLPIIVDLTNELISEYTSLLSDAGELLLWFNPVFMVPNLVLYLDGDDFTGGPLRVPYLGDLDFMGMLAFQILIGALYIVAGIGVMKLAAVILAKRTLRKS